MARILLDASLLVRCAELKVDPYAELDRLMPGAYEPVVLDRTLGELEGLARGATREGRAAKLALTVLRHKRVAVVPAPGSGDVDTLILDAARKGDVVATQDMELKRRLRAKGVAVITLRGKEKLAFFGV